MSDFEAQVKALDITQGDLLVVSVPGSISDSVATLIRKQVRDVTGKQVLVLSDGIEIGYLVGLTPKDYQRMADTDALAEDLAEPIRKALLRKKRTSGSLGLA